ncbi:DUF5685 family protein [Clostridium sp. JNZ J1-5]
MFGYVAPYKMELKIKDFEKFKSYYCGLCISIKRNFGNLPRFTLNYDMTFLAILLDSLEDHKASYIKSNCIAHPTKQKIIIVDNQSLNYAAFCNVCLTYYKLLDDFQDDSSIKSKILSSFLNKYLKALDDEQNNIMKYIEKRLMELSTFEKYCYSIDSLDRLSHPFADLTGFIISSYIKDPQYKLDLYWLGYNLGKWIYILDAYDDLEKDMCKNKFNAINVTLNTDKLDYNKFKSTIEHRIDFILTNCSRECYEYFKRLPIVKNYDLIDNILQYGLLDKANLVFKRRDFKNEKSL